ncbi:MAG TPA: fluoride efflux transporter CrcB [Longimicrobiales bacterium]
MIHKLLLAGVGGFIGSAARYALGVGTGRIAAALMFPIATLLVNVIGSLIIGAFLAFTLTRDTLTDEARVFVVVGILGGFTTFSSFSMDTLLLWREAGGVRAAMNVLLNVATCLLAVWIGDALGRSFAR